jgi:hypothetical protein
MLRGAIPRLAILPASEPGEQRENGSREGKRTEHDDCVFHRYSPSRRRPNQTTISQNAVPAARRLNDRKPVGIPRANYYERITPPGEKNPRGGLNEAQARSMADAIDVLKQEGATVIDANIPSVVDQDLSTTSCCGVARATKVRAIRIARRCCGTA